MIDEELSPGRVASSDLVVDADPAKIVVGTAADQLGYRCRRAAVLSVSTDGELARIDVILARDPSPTPPRIDPQAS